MESMKPTQSVDHTKPMEYICMECKQITQMGPKDQVRCKHCAKTILYKTRDKSVPVQLLAL